VRYIFVFAEVLLKPELVDNVAWKGIVLPSARRNTIIDGVPAG
jgi:hypothetical protein